MSHRREPAAAMSFQPHRDLAALCALLDRFERDCAALRGMQKRIRGAASSTAVDALMVEAAGCLAGAMLARVMMGVVRAARSGDTTTPPAT